MNKKASHVGMVLSFVIFITFLMLLYTVLEPGISQQENKEYFLEIAQQKIVSYLNSNFTTTTIRVNEEFEMPECGEIKQIISPRENVIVKDLSEDILEASSENTNVKIKSTGSEKRFKIYSSEKFEKNSEIETCENIEGNYEVGSTNTEQQIFEKSILSFIEDYNKNYLELKNKLGIGEDFGFIFERNNTEISTNFEARSTNIYSKEVPILYIDSDANAKFGVIKIKIW